MISTDALKSQFSQPAAVAQGGKKAGSSTRSTPAISPVGWKKKPPSEPLRQFMTPKSTGSNVIFNSPGPIPGTPRDDGYEYRNTEFITGRQKGKTTSVGPRKTPRTEDRVVLSKVGTQPAVAAGAAIKKKIGDATESRNNGRGGDEEKESDKHPALELPSQSAAAIQLTMTKESASGLYYRQLSSQTPIAEFESIYTDQTMEAVMESTIAGENVLPVGGAEVIGAMEIDTERASGVAGAAGVVSAVGVASAAEVVGTKNAYPPKSGGAYEKPSFSLEESRTFMPSDGLFSDNATATEVASAARVVRTKEVNSSKSGGAYKKPPFSLEKPGTFMPSDGVFSDITTAAEIARAATVVQAKNAYPSKSCGDYEKPPSLEESRTSVQSDSLSSDSATGGSLFRAQTPTTTPISGFPQLAKNDEWREAQKAKKRRELQVVIRAEPSEKMDEAPSRAPPGHSRFSAQTPIGSPIGGGEDALASVFDHPETARDKLGSQLPPQSKEGVYVSRAAESLARAGNPSIPQLCPGSVNMRRASSAASVKRAERQEVYIDTAPEGTADGSSTELKEVDSTPISRSQLQADVAASAGTQQHSGDDSSATEKSQFLTQTPIGSPSGRAWPAIEEIELSMEDLWEDEGEGLV